MGDAYPELRQRAQHIVNTTRVEEQSFLDDDRGRPGALRAARADADRAGGSEIRGTISGDDAFRLYDTFGFPIDLTELMARERGYLVDIAGFEAALDAQRKRSQEERKSKQLGVVGRRARRLARVADAAGGFERPTASFVGYDSIEIETQVTAVKHFTDGRVAIMLRESPFYAESGGQISDRGEIIGEGWRVDVDDVKKVDGRPAALGTISGHVPLRSRHGARAERSPARHGAQSHGDAPAARGAAPGARARACIRRARSSRPIGCDSTLRITARSTRERLAEIEAIVNREIWRGAPVTYREMAYPEARAAGAMALFGEKYGDVVRVVTIPGFSMELCGGTHVRNTSEIGIFKIVAETGVAAGVRRIEAVTGPGAYEMLRGEERALRRVAELLKTPVDGLEKRVAGLIEERRGLERRLDEAMRGGGDQLQNAAAARASRSASNGSRLVASVVRAGDVKELQALGDAIREKLGSGVGVLAASFEDGKNALLVVVTDDLRERGVRADALIKDIAAAAGGEGGGKPHMAQAGIPDAARFGEALVARAGARARRARRRVVTLGAWLRERSPAPPDRLAARASTRVLGDRAATTTRRRRRSCASPPPRSCCASCSRRPTDGPRVGARPSHRRRARDLRVRGGRGVARVAAQRCRRTP